MVHKEFFIFGCCFPELSLLLNLKPFLKKGQTVSNDSMCQVEHRKIHRLFYIMRGNSINKEVPLPSSNFLHSGSHLPKPK